MKFKDEIHTSTTIKFSFVDKLRVLIGCKVTLNVSVKTENVVGATETESRVTVEKVFKKETELGAYSAQA